MVGLMVMDKGNASKYFEWQRRDKPSVWEEVLMGSVWDIVV